VGLGVAESALTSNNKEPVMNGSNGHETLIETITKAALMVLPIEHVIECMSRRSAEDREALQASLGAGAVVLAERAIDLDIGSTPADERAERAQSLVEHLVGVHDVDLGIAQTDKLRDLLAQHTTKQVAKAVRKSGHGVVMASTLPVPSDTIRAALHDGSIDVEDVVRLALEYDEGIVLDCVLEDCGADVIGRMPSDRMLKEIDAADAAAFYQHEELLVEISQGTIIEHLRVHGAVPVPDGMDAVRRHAEKIIDYLDVIEA